MTKLLDAAIAKIQELPADLQDEAAEVLFLITSRDREPIPLDPATRAAVLEGLEQTRRGEFASPEEIEKILRPQPE